MFTRIFTASTKLLSFSCEKTTKDPIFGVNHKAYRIVFIRQPCIATYVSSKRRRLHMSDREFEILLTPVSGTLYEIAERLLSQLIFTRF